VEEKEFSTIFGSIVVKVFSIFFIAKLELLCLGQVFCEGVLIGVRYMRAFIKAVPTSLRIWYCGETTKIH
jgi:hypothetical protein